MRNFSLLLMIISLTTACGSIKDKQLLKANTSEAEAIEMNSNLSIGTTTNEVITDSSRQDYLVEI